MSPHSTLHQAVALLWAELPKYFGDRWPDIDVRLTALLRRLEGDAPVEAEDDLFDIFASSPQALAELNRTIANLTKAAERAAAPSGHGVPAGTTGALERAVVIPVFFGTDREVDRSGQMVTYAGIRANGLQLGVACVSIPDDHRMGAIERPRRWRLEFREDPARHVVITAVEELERGQFIARARQAGTEAMFREALVFVHGYNVAFDDAVRRTAQIAYDLHFGGVAMLFSWPSCGTLQGYLADEASVRWAQNDFRKFLRLTLSELGLTTVHVIAHSMGNRVLAEVLGGALPVREEESWARLDHIVFAAPDIDTATFAQLAAEFHGHAGRCTLYASSKDHALKRSRRFHGYSRAGYCVDGVFVTDGIDTIDASAVDTSLMGHSYYGDNRSVLADLFQLFRLRTGPDQRFGLIARACPKGCYWEFRPGG